MILICAIYICVFVVVVVAAAVVVRRLFVRCSNTGWCGSVSSGACAQRYGRRILDPTLAARPPQPATISLFSLLLHASFDTQQLSIATLFSIKTRFNNKNWPLTIVNPTSNDCNENSQTIHYCYFIFKNLLRNNKNVSTNNNTKTT
jgi:hypothetical protein